MIKLCQDSSFVVETVESFFFDKFFKIICIGGAVTMASGEERSIPEIMDKLGLEFLWRLRKETYRRTKRLLTTYFYFLYGKFE